MSLAQIVGPTWAGFTLDLNLSLPLLSGALIMAFSWGTTYLDFSTRRTSAVGH